MENVHGYNKFTKINCTYSGISVKLLNCDINPNGAAFGNVTLIRNLTKVFVKTKFEWFLEIESVFFCRLQ